MTATTLKHLKPEFGRDFDMVGYDTAKRAEWIRNNQDKYETVADIELNVDSIMQTCNIIYDATQNHDHGWVESLKRVSQNVYVDQARSTSVGDIMLCNGKAYFVDSFGFSPISKDSYEG